MTLNLDDARVSLNFKLKTWQSGDSPAFNDDELEMAVKDAVSEYSRVRPRRVVEDFPVISGQQSYSFPVGCLSVQPGLYSTDEISYGLANLSPEMVALLYAGGTVFDPESPANQTRAKIYQSILAESRLNRLEVNEEAQTIMLFPAPKETVTGKIIVDYAHVLDEDSQSYLTVQPKDVSFILGYAQATLMESLADAYSLNSNDVGDRKNRGLNLAEYLRNNAEKLKKAFESRFQVPVAVRS